MPSIPDEHRQTAPTAVRCAVVTVSDTRTRDNDTGGATVAEMLAIAGHQVVDRHIVRDEPGPLTALLGELAAEQKVEAILMTGGTGISSRDQTFETVVKLLTKSLPGYGELFRMLSFQEIGPAAMLSRAVGGLIGQTIVLTMPGSPAAVRLAMEKLVLPELGHMCREAGR